MAIREFRLERFLAEREFRAPYVLGASDCETMSVQELLSLEPGSEDDLLRLRLGYVEPAGSPSLREAIAGLYSGVSPHEVITFNGASEGIMAFMNTALRPGDHVIVQFPAYQSLYEVARSVGCDVTFWKMDEEKGWSPDLGALQDLVRPTTKVLVINSPHNPTGYQFPERDFRALARFAGDRASSSSRMRSTGSSNTGPTIASLPWSIYRALTSRLATSQRRMGLRDSAPGG